MKKRPLFSTPLLLALGILGIAPFWGTVQEQLRDQLGIERLAIVFGAIFLLAGAAAVVWAARVIDSRRGLRYGLIALAIALAATQVLISDRGYAEIAERMHLLLYGLLAFFFFRDFRRLLPRLWYTVPSTMLAVTLVGLLDELVQVFFVVRTGELYDVSLNVFAGALGVLVSLGVFGLPERTEAATPVERRAGLRRLVTLFGFTLLCFGVLFHRAHMGYRIVDPELGTFYTYTRPDLLEETNRDRARRWAESPPGPKWRLLELQDDFRIEVGWRVAHRNASFEAGNLFTAWREQRILERYFWSFLESTSREGVTYYLSPEQRETLRSGARDDGRPYLSPVGVEPRRIFAWPSKGLFWTIVASGCLLCALLRRRLRQPL